MTSNSCKRSFRIRAFAFVLILVFLFPSSSVVMACGPFSLDVVFSLQSHPEFPLESFGEGKTGIVPKSYGPMSLVLFYRLLNGTSLRPSENKLAVAAMENQIYFRSGILDKEMPEQTAAPASPTDVWTAARSKVASDAVDISVDREIGYHYYVNCLPDAFQTAADTLNARIAEHGISDEVREWVKGQDAVFANCSQDSALPASLTSGPDWLRFDREYQIAAAVFYQNKNDDARTRLSQIASEKASPWREAARFNAARTYVREASLLVSPDGEESDATMNPERQKLLARAVDAFEAIRDDAGMGEMRGSAIRMIGLAKYRMIPDERRKELASILTRSDLNENFYNDLTDFALIIDKEADAARSLGETREAKEAEKAGKDYQYDYHLQLRDVSDKARTDDLSDWIFTYNAADGLSHAVEKWRSSSKVHWLLAALSTATGSSPETPALLEAAAKVAKDSPAFPTARFHEVRLLIEQGKRDQARAKLDEIGPLQQFPVSTRNSFLALRTSLARSLDEFLVSAQRQPSMFTWSDTGREEPSQIESGTKLTPWAKRSMFDADAEVFFSERAPLSVLKQAAVSPKLPDYLRSMLVRAVWMRAFILKNAAVEREFAPLIAADMRGDAPLFQNYVAAKRPVDREAAALLAVLRYPILEPYVESGYGREDSVSTEIDSIRGNWWCVDRGDGQAKVAAPAFLTAAQLADATSENKLINSLGLGATVLAGRALEFAKRNPTHRQTPEILHLAVRATRYGCTDDATGGLSKQAFDLLHTRYRTSPWTKQTPYWFNGLR